MQRSGKEAQASIHPGADKDCIRRPAQSVKPRITVIDYDEGHFQETEVKSVEECFIFKDRPFVTWINIDCLRQMDILEKLGACYGFHPLVLEDILTDQRPKIEDYDDYIFIVLKMLYYDEREMRCLGRPRLTWTRSA